MKRPVVTAVLLFAVAGLAGCPIYDHQSDGCYRDSDCAQNYVCNTQSGDCVLPSVFKCTKPSDCDSTYTCTPAGACMSGDCSFNGCVSGYRCDSSSGVWACSANDSAGAGGEAGAAGATQGSGQAGQAGAAGQSGADAGGVGGA